MNMEQDEPKYVQVLRERYTPADDAEYEEEADFLWMLNAPEQCEVQEEVLGYMEAHPEARLKELVQFFDSLFPDGIPEEYQAPEDEADFLWMLNAPEQCEVQEEVLGYMEAHPEARLKELVQFFDSLFPDGIPEEYQAPEDEEAWPCPVCGQHNFEEADDFEECPVCGWVNDGVQQADPDYPGGYNRISLNDARKKWKAGRKVWD